MFYALIFKVPGKVCQQEAVWLSVQNISRDRASVHAIKNMLLLFLHILPE